jgi:hypothetical protein
MPLASASSSIAVARPEKKSIQTDVSTTTPLTRLLQIDRQRDLTAECERPLVRTMPLDLLEALDQCLGDPFASRSHGVIEQF